MAPVAPPVGGMAAQTEGLLGSAVTEAFDVVLMRSDFLGKHRFSGALRSVVAVVNAAGLVGGLLLRLARHRPHIVHVATNSYAGFFEKALLTLVARLAGRKVMLHIHGGAFSDFYRGSSRPVRWLIRRCLAWNHRVVALSEGIRAQLVSICVDRQRAVVLGNAVIVPPLSALECDRGEGHDRAHVEALFLNRVEPAKGVLELLDAAELVHARNQDIAFRIVGPCEETFRREIEERIAARRMVSFVRLEDTVEGEARTARYAGADIYVLPSHVEGMPVGLLEAMAAGLACVATRVGAVPEVITDGADGVLVPARDAAALAAAIEGLATDAGVRRLLGSAARRTAERRFNWRVRAGEAIALYEAMIAGGS